MNPSNEPKVCPHFSEAFRQRFEPILCRECKGWLLADGIIIPLETAPVPYPHELGTG